MWKVHKLRQRYSNSHLWCLKHIKFGLRNVGQRYFKGWYLSLMHVTLDKFNVCSHMPQFINKKTIFHNY